MIASTADIDAHNLQFRRRKGRLINYRAPAFTIVGRVGEVWRQFAQVGFIKSDGSIRVEWPYLKITQGIVAHVQFPETEHNDSITLSLRDNGKFSSQLLKLTHHTSGEALFSKTGHARSEIRKPSFPLRSSIGRVFEINVLLPEGFKQLTRLKRDRGYIAWPDLNITPGDAVRIRGEWRRTEHIVENSDSHTATVGPRTTWTARRTGVVERVFFAGQPLDSALRDFLLCVTAITVPPPTGSTESGIVCLGGFSPHFVPEGGDPKDYRVRDALVAMYPSNASNDVVTAIGSLDLMPKLI